MAKEVLDAYKKEIKDNVIEDKVELDKTLEEIVEIEAKRRRNELIRSETLRQYNQIIRETKFY